MAGLLVPDQVAGDGPQAVLGGEGPGYLLDRTIIIATSTYDEKELKQILKIR